MSTRLTSGLLGARLVRELGRGSTSRVWLAEDVASGLRLTLKVGETPAARNRLADEAERLMLAGSPALARVLDAGLVPTRLSLDGHAGIEAGSPAVALEWTPGAALDPNVERTSDERLALGLAVARDVGDALEDLHALGVAHGDVKPANIIVDRTVTGYACRLIDLGLATRAEQVMPDGASPRYLPPAFLGGADLGDARSRDLFALGVTLAEISSCEVARAVQPAPAARKVDLPPAIAGIARALLAECPGLRPSAGWVRRRALLGLGQVSDGAGERGQRAVCRAYLAVRSAEVSRAARSRLAEVSFAGAPADWLNHTLVLARRVLELRGGEACDEPVVLRELDAFGRARWLVGLVGPAAAAWPAFDGVTDAELAERLNDACSRREPQSLTLGDLSRRASTGAEPAPSDPIALGLALGSGAATDSLLDTAERWVVEGGNSGALAVALGRQLRLSGQLGRALSVLSHAADATARVEAAETARRAGDPKTATAMLEALPAGALPSALAARAATLARIAQDRGDASAALATLDAAPESARVLEARAYARFAMGQHAAAARDVERARVLAADDEERARIEAMAGVLAHASGDAERALASFLRAAEHAGRAGAVLEEATYLTGVAAAATNLGELGQALAAARRAILLFEHLGRPADAARAALARAVVYVSAGATHDARDAAEHAVERALVAGDQRCLGYALFALADALGDEAAEGLAHVRRARELLTDQNIDDRLYVAARLLRRERAGAASVDVAGVDALAESATAGLDARLEWWGARATLESRRDSPQGAGAIVAELCALCGSRAATAVRGAAFSAGARLAARAGDGEAARRLTLEAAEAAHELVRRAPPELKTAISSLDWLTSVKTDTAASFAPEQLADVETLVRALGRRDRLRPLLDQVLDALVLWTGVERGLLLLRAPGDKLVPRAARNLARADLEGAQLELSRSLAERALAQREPVVAVDAAGELSELHTSVHALKLRSVLAVPLLARGEALGVVYLDDRVRRGAFGPRELAWVRLVATLAALAIADARDQILLRRAARRAERAEARLARELARREAELDVAERELARTRELRETRFSYDDIVGTSEPIRSMLRVVDRVTAADVPVLIMGDSGSGKELVARAIHANGRRSGAQFVTENCAAIPEGLLESTLFGHVRGAFTGASRPRAGLFEIADRGTLFLDEIAEMSLGMQTKLLRVLEAGEVRPVGSERERRVDVRVIAATHRDLEARVKAGAFREDLYYRLNVISIRVPSLRERPSDIPLLVLHFLALHSPERPLRVSKAALDALCAYGWPGNVRQLENEVRRALVLADDAIELEHLSPEVRTRGSEDGARADGLNVRQRIDALETELVRAALNRTAGNQTRAAELLGLSRFGLQKMMRRLEIVARPRVLRLEPVELRERR